LGRIRVLGDQVANRIAAGEVVERPASVVKELVENSLDAGATSVEVSVASGGKRRILVRDDGQGMDRDDALLSLERHATSKLSAFEDLKSLATLGFRGEALASIASVSRLAIRTGTGDGLGTEVESSGGRITAVRDVAWARGTQVEAGSLFFNVPARRKFLKSDTTELARIVRLLTQLSLSLPAVRFRLEHEGRVLLDCPPAADRAARVRQAFGERFFDRLLPFERARGGVSITGFVLRPADAGRKREAPHLFVNGRSVEDRMLSHGILAGLENAVVAGSSPTVMLFVEIDPALVDVNVHPRKAEVRFVRGGEVHDLVAEAVASALSAEGGVPTLEDLRPLALGVAGGAVGEAAIRYLETAERRAVYEAPRRTTSCAPEGTKAPTPVDPVRRLPLEAMEGRATALAQYEDSYIVARAPDGLLLVDQHAAHERVLFERHLAAAEAEDVAVQKLLFPVLVDLDPSEKLVLEEEAPELRRLGFEIEGFGDATARLDAVPSFTSSSDPSSLLHAVLGDAARVRSTLTGVGEVRRRLVTTAACHAAIKVNHPLTQEGMQRLLDDLFRTANPTTCPHGRPSVFRLTLEEIERAFRRR
jgi:DNA mismatch repair protein MutL